MRLPPISFRMFGCIFGSLLFTLVLFILLLALLTLDAREQGRMEMQSTFSAIQTQVQATLNAE